MRTLALMVLVASLLPLPAGAKEMTAVTDAAFLVEPTEVDTTLYFHPLNIQDMPVNTQVPPYDPALFEEELGAHSMTLTCLHKTTGDLGGTGQGTAGMTSRPSTRIGPTPALPSSSTTTLARTGPRARTRSAG